MSNNYKKALIAQCQKCKAMGVTWRRKSWLIKVDHTIRKCPICGNVGVGGNFYTHEAIEVPNGTLLTYNEQQIDFTN